MNWPSANSPTTPRNSLLRRLCGVVVLTLPLAALIGMAYRSGGTPQPILAGGIAAVAFLALGLLHQVGAGAAAGHKSASPLYLITVLILWMTTKDYNDTFMQASMGTLLGVPLSLFVLQEFLVRQGHSQRRARSLVRRLAAKRDWPEDLAMCKSLPEVKALRDALREDAEPALELLMHPQPHARIAALTALEFRPSWRKGQAETVLRAAKFAAEPPVRAAAMTALANIDDPRLTGTMVVYLRDPSAEVRRAAAESLLWDAERRWPHVRREIRTALADPRCANDGPLPCSGGLPKSAITDLAQWSSESGPVGRRATLTLVDHYRRELNENPSEELVEELAERIANGGIPSALRLEYAHLLTANECSHPSLWRNLLEPGQPSSLRLLAAGAMLRESKDALALETLREVARVPNREIALQVAAIVQKFLRIDMGLPLGGPMPKTQSKQAAEIARRVIDWADGKATDLVDQRTSRRSRIGSPARQVSKLSGESPRRRM